MAFISDGLVSSDIDFTDSKEVLLNPERGFYTLNSVRFTNPITEDDLKEVNPSAENICDYLSDNQETLALTVFYLKQYSDEDLSSDVLVALDSYCSIFRKRGYKLVVRFAYFDDDAQTDPNNFNQILTHMDNLRPFFEKIKDVIHAVQLGFMQFKIIDYIIILIIVMAIK